MRDLQPGTWTAVVYVSLYREGPRRRFPMIQCAFIRLRSGHVLETDSTNHTVFRPENLEILGIEEFLRTMLPNFNDGTAAALHRRLEQLDQFGPAQERSGWVPVSFSRAMLDSSTVCRVLYKKSKRKGQVPTERS
jgi:hypothetical protein